MCLQLLQQWAQGRANNHISAVALSDHAGEATLLFPVDAVGVEHDALASIKHSPPKVPLNPVVALAMHDRFAFAGVESIKLLVEGQEVAMIGVVAASIAQSCLAGGDRAAPFCNGQSAIFVARTPQYGGHSYFLRAVKLVPAG